MRQKMMKSECVVLVLVQHSVLCSQKKNKERRKERNKKIEWIYGCHIPFLNGSRSGRVFFMACDVTHLWLTFKSGKFQLSIFVCSCRYINKFAFGNSTIRTQNRRHRNAWAATWTASYSFESISNVGWSSFKQTDLYVCCNTGFTTAVADAAHQKQTQNSSAILKQSKWMNWIRQLRIEASNAYIIHTFYVRCTTIFDGWIEIKWTKKKSYLYSHHCRFVVIVKFNFKFYFLFSVALHFFLILFPAALCSTLSVCLSIWFSYNFLFVLFFTCVSTISLLWVWHADCVRVWWTRNLFFAACYTSIGTWDIAKAQRKCSRTAHTHITFVSDMMIATRIYEYLYERVSLLWNAN